MSEEETQVGDAPLLVIDPLLLPYLDPEDRQVLNKVLVGLRLNTSWVLASDTIPAEDQVYLARSLGLPWGCGIELTSDSSLEEWVQRNRGPKTEVMVLPKSLAGEDMTRTWIRICGFLDDYLADAATDWVNDWVLRGFSPMCTLS